jgi:hypothetical protein
MSCELGRDYVGELIGRYRRGLLSHTDRALLINQIAIPILMAALTRSAADKGPHAGPDEFVRLAPPALLLQDQERAA